MQGKFTYPRIKLILKDHILKPILNFDNSSHSFSLYGIMEICGNLTKKQANSQSNPSN